MSLFRNEEFDVVFSNSVIEHLGEYPQQRRMADEVRRAGKRYFLQTPNRYFPLEPHFFFPFFQFLPVSVRVWLLSRFHLGWHKRGLDRRTAERIVMGDSTAHGERIARVISRRADLEGEAVGIDKVICGNPGVG